jgi:hypothetical protein
VLLPTSRSRHAVVITPVESLGRIAHGTAYSTRFPARQRRRPSPCQCRVGSHVNRFEACSTFTRVTACLIAGPPSGPLSRRLQRFRHLHHCFDSFRLERTSCRGDWLPLEIRNLSRRTLTPTVLLKNVGAEPSVYFVHSYHAVPDRGDDIAAVADYPDPVAAIVWRDNLMACQFHPEKSQATGLAIYANFIAM